MKFLNFMNEISLLKSMFNNAISNCTKTDNQIRFSRTGTLTSVIGNTE